jgi:hypothetical protein
MSSRSVVTITCDQCAHLNQPEVFATTTVVVKFNGDPTRQVDLCDDHAAIVQALQAMVRSRGVRPEVDTGKYRLRCGVCGQVCRGGAGLAAHSRARHGAAT